MIEIRFAAKIEKTEPFVYFHKKFLTLQNLGVIEGKLPCKYSTHSLVYDSKCAQTLRLLTIPHVLKKNVCEGELQRATLGHGSLVPTHSFVAYLKGFW